MKVVILAGGFGTRISEESHLKPKPLIEIGGFPILWHIMKLYSEQGFNDFVICLGYRGHEVKNYFAEYQLRHSDVEFDFTGNNCERKLLQSKLEQWRVTLIDTGLNTMTGGRLKRLEPYLNGEDFFMTYGDGVADINLERLLAQHNEMNTIATLTAVQPHGKFGALTISDGRLVTAFMEKPKSAWINGGFFVMKPDIFRYLKDDTTILEQEPLSGLARDGQLSAFLHQGFWHPMDTARDKNHLEDLWSRGEAPWKIW